jgi:PleD family two-component response regulator
LFFAGKNSHKHSLTSLENTYKSIRKSLETQFLQKNHLPLQHMAKILVIEDENRMAELLKRGLEESGHTVGTATNVSEKCPAIHKSVSMAR